MSQATLSFKEERVLFFGELGMAISRWTRIEVNLFQFMNWCFKTNEQAKLSISYFSIENFRSKLQVVDRLIKDTLEDKRSIAEWRSLHGRIERQAKVRNQLAHHPVIQFSKNAPGRRIAVSPTLEAMVPLFRSFEKSVTELQAEPPPGSLFVRDIAQHRMQFDALRRDMRVVHARLFGRSVPSDEYPTPVGRPPTIAQMQKTIRDRFSRANRAQLPMSAFDE